MVGKRVKKSKKSGWLRSILSVTILVVLVAGILVPVYCNMLPGVTAEAKDKEVMSGVNVQGVDLSNLERREGINQLAKLETRVRDTKVNLLYNDAEYEVTMGELGVTVDREKTMDRALAMGNELGVFKRWYAEVRHVDRPLAPVLSLDEQNLRQCLEDLIGPLQKDALDAYLKIHADDRVEVIPARNGYTVDIGLLTKNLISRPMLSDGADIDVPLTIIQPGVNAEQVREWGVTGLMAEFTTYFNPAQANRNHNIATAAKKLDGWLIGPGEVFSFNRVVGPRGGEQGYRMANVVVGNKLEEDLGGGVCQVSTTLYNAVLLADLAVEQRGNHNITVSYVPMGRDAAVAYDYLDFKFKNNLKSHVLIKTFTGGSDLTVKIYGAPNPDKKVQINSWVTKTMEPETVYEVDPTVEPGTQKVVQKGARGYNAAAERLVLVNGQEVKRELLFGSKYRPVEQIIAVQSKDEIPQTKPGEENPVEEPPDDVTGGTDEPDDGGTPSVPDGIPLTLGQPVI